MNRSYPNPLVMANSSAVQIIEVVQLFFWWSRVAALDVDSCIKLFSSLSACFIVCLWMYIYHVYMYCAFKTRLLVMFLLTIAAQTNNIHITFCKSLLQRGRQVRPTNQDYYKGPMKKENKTNEQSTTST